MNDLDDKNLDWDSFSYQNILGLDSWTSFTPVFTSLTVVGGTSYSGRWRRVGKKVEFQVKFSAATSIASTAGTTYMALPVGSAKGLAGMSVMTNNNTLTAVGVCHVDVATSRVYLPAQVASGNVFTVAGWYEV